MELTRVSCWQTSSQHAGHRSLGDGQHPPKKEQVPLEPLPKVKVKNEASHLGASISQLPRPLPLAHTRGRVRKIK